jgi:cellulose synthase/poly-beta-1,6-N-acetylglucosamine synthase-like glycosyltransferase
VIGNNLAVRRSAYDMTGGYRNIPFSVTEDYALVQAILKKSALEVRFPVDPRTVVTSKACPTWKQLYRQKQRWGVGGLDMIPRGKFIMLVGWACRVSLLVGFFLSPLPLVLAAAGCLVLTDLQFLWKPLRRLGRTGYLKYFPAFEVYFFFYVLLIAIVAYFSRGVVWKERKL